MKPLPSSAGAAAEVNLRQGDLANMGCATAAGVPVVLIGDIDRTEQILAETARPYEGVQTSCLDAGVPNNAAGYGVVDAYAAVQAALALP